jgi:hypothetical protein
MGLVYANLTLFNASDKFLKLKGNLSENEIRQTQVIMLVDSGAYMMAVNEETKEKLGLEVVKKQKFELGNGEVEEFEIVGYIEVHFENRTAVCNAVLLKGTTEMVLGAIPMEEMDVIIHPSKNKLMVNPEHPDMGQLKMK